MLIPVFRAAADEWNKKRVMTSSPPKELPGVALPAGAYRLEPVNLQGSWNAECPRELPGPASPIAMLLPLGSPSFVLAPAVRAMARDN
jgi:hypothetical protein